MKQHPLRAVKLVNQQNYHIGFIRTPIHSNIIANEGLSMIEFMRFPLQLVVSMDHPLAQKRGYTFIRSKRRTFYPL
ncbi:hypothetical protein RCO48_27110 [Peribacillus frigoritolerans]|nr:hypothetical protein [Peribacillus frigoritolerans]